ncbi:carbohydrate ABC transporter permease [Streptomyces aidingensis]|uniref:Multiple sugar transport system permease protein n=1 Tax=Streptomyces aidingensis TaxID=910347 RepID=A0A1I1FWL8_9ACTN|nr:carbohydrate ABC transporter permease [Streptomyces aidingensis]SFC03422.1 multiple sugar transport system permease protein [Streptomyces aidingensis]
MTAPATAAPATAVPATAVPATAVPAAAVPAAAVPAAAVPATPPAAAARPPWPRRNAGQIALTAIALPLALLWLLPFGWALSTSLKPEGETQVLPVHWIPQDVTLGAYRSVLGEGDLQVWLLNSLIVSVGVTALCVAVSAAAAYGFARTRFRFRRALFGLTLAGIMVPGTVLTAPLFATMRSLGLVDTYWGIILPQVVAPAMVFILYTFFRGIPRELEEAAVLDGAGRWRIFLTIVVPLSRPVLAAVSIFVFIVSWNNFMWPFLVTTDPDLATLPVGLATVAGALLAALPLLLVFVFFQRQIVRGVAHTGIAGS